MWAINKKKNLNKCKTKTLNWICSRWRNLNDFSTIFVSKVKVEKLPNTSANFLLNIFAHIMEILGRKRFTENQNHMQFYMYFYGICGCHFVFWCRVLRTAICVALCNAWFYVTGAAALPPPPTPAAASSPCSLRWKRQFHEPSCRYFCQFFAASCKLLFELVRVWHTHTHTYSHTHTRVR